METILINLFYLFGCVIIIFDLEWILDTKNKLIKIKNLDELLTLQKISPTELRSDYILLLYCKTVLPQLIKYAWLTIGIFTSQWLLFANIIVFNNLFLIIEKQNIAFKRKLLVRKINCGVGMGIVLLIYFNFLFFKIDFSKLIWWFQ